jgi:hypothetical protein
VKNNKKDSKALAAHAHEMATHLFDSIGKLNDADDLKPKLQELQE